ncbi:BQ2448_4838 [Microbotryum intermedium]|uniref:BQ2448_4838 protein n=1 Tax=Microbotryum intermedium TaxID=269621 RepID=A0A238FJT1_9BASI|nr:BQ2448_4838 [Microbotryum intermedium]
MSVAHTPSQMRHQRHPLDTPTPASSSGHHSTLITSLKPSRSRSNLSSEIKRAISQHAQPPVNRTAFGNLNGRFAAAPPPSSSPAYASVPAVIEEEGDILTDNTERERLNLENEIRLGMGELNRQAGGLRSGASSSGDSIGYGDLSDDLEQGHGLRQQTSTLPRQRHHQQHHGLRARIEDESSGAEDNGESSEPSMGDDFSLRIGLAGNRASSAAAHSVMPTGSAIRAAARALDQDDLTFTGMQRSPAPSPPYVRAAAAARPPPTDENRPPVAATAAPSSSFMPASSKSLPMRSPSNINNAASRASAIHSISPAIGPTYGNPSKVSSSMPHFGEPSHRLPDVTGLTDGLTSPARSRRNHYVAAPVPRRPNSAQAVGSEATAVANAIDDLRSRLQDAETANAQLMRALTEKDQRPAVEVRRASPAFVHAPAQNSPGLTRREVEEMFLRRDQESTLRARLTQLERQVASHEIAIAQLRALPRVNEHDQQRVTELNERLKTMLTETNVVKNAVEELLHDKLVKEQWEREEMNRKREMDGHHMRSGRDQGPTPPPPPGQMAGAANADPDRTPRAQRTVHRLGAEPTAIPPPQPIIRPATAPPRQSVYDCAAPTPAPAPVPAPMRASAVPQPMHTDAAYDRSYASTADSSNSANDSPSTAASSPMPEPDFRRAEALFESMSMQDPSKRRKNVCKLCGNGLKKKKVPRRSANLGGAGGNEKGFAGGVGPTMQSAAAAPAVDHKQELRYTLEKMEAAFAVQKQLYIELSEQYRAMDSRVSDGRRRMLATHLKDSIDVLETMAEEIQKFDACFHQFTTNQGQRRREGVI